MIRTRQDPAEPAIWRSFGSAGLGHEVCLSRLPGSLGARLRHTQRTANLPSSGCELRLASPFGKQTYASPPRRRCSATLRPRPLPPSSTVIPHAGVAFKHRPEERKPCAQIQHHGMHGTRAGGTHAPLIDTHAPWWHRGVPSALVLTCSLQHVSRRWSRSVGAAHTYTLWREARRTLAFAWSPAPPASTDAQTRRALTLVVCAPSMLLLLCCSPSPHTSCTAP